MFVSVPFLDLQNYEFAEAESTVGSTVSPYN